MTQTGLRREALEYILRVWGRMVDEGATTPWEIEQRFGGYFHPGYWHLAVASSCHGGYASYPQYWLQKELLGIHGPDLEGRITIKPGIDLAPAASGLCRFPAGSVEVTWEAKTKSLQVGGSYEGPVDIVEPW